MNELLNLVEKIIRENPYKIVLSGNRDRSVKQVHKKINIMLKKPYYQIEKISDNKVFNENINSSELFNYVFDMMQKYHQLDAWTKDYEYRIKITKKEKILFSKTKNSTLYLNNAEHNRKKKYILSEGTIIEPLIDMGIFTQSGKVVNSMYDKYKQINKFVEIIDDAIMGANLNELTIIDFGCGKSYLTFILYYYFTEIKKIKVKMIGLDLKEEVIEKCNQIAKKYRYNNLLFEKGNIRSYKCDFPVDIVISLHACDTATDYALYNAIKWDAKMIFSVPCCQHELNNQIKSDAYSILTRYGIAKERIASLITDVIRCNLLESCSYKVQLLEFIDFDHTPKNMLIRATKSVIPKHIRNQFLIEVLTIINEFNLDPALYRLLKEEGFI